MWNLFYHSEVLISLDIITSRADNCLLNNCLRTMICSGAKEKKKVVFLCFAENNALQIE